MSDLRNQFEQALREGNIAEFLAGDPPYYLDSRNDNEEPQNVRSAFDRLVYPLWEKTRAQGMVDELENGFERLLRSNKDKNRAIYVTLDWIVYYYQCRAKWLERGDERYRGIFHLRTDRLIAMIYSGIRANRDELETDTRWAGATWNSANGLLGPITRMLEYLHDHCGWPPLIRGRRRMMNRHQVTGSKNRKCG